MKLLGILLLAGFAAGSVDAGSSPVCKNDVRIFVTIGKDSFHEKFKKYTSEHDIVNILVPLNDLNYFNLGKNGEDFNVNISVLFFVAGDYKDDGTFESKGLFHLNTKTGEATKLLDNGVDFTSVQDRPKVVYFAATDGIYVYNCVRNTAEKYGSVTDSIISIAKPRIRDFIYALTAERELYKVTENGKKKVKVDEVKNAQKIVMGHTDKLFFYNDKKEVFSIDFENNVNKVEGLPDNPNKVTLLRPILFSHHRDVLRQYHPVIIDEKVYMIQADGKSASKPAKINCSYSSYPTAFAFEALVAQYIAHNKTIYEFLNSRFYDGDFDDVSEDVLHSFDFSIHHANFDANCIPLTTPKPKRRRVF